MTFYRKWGTEMLKELPEASQLLEVDRLLLEPIVCYGTWLSESVRPSGKGRWLS